MVWIQYLNDEMQLYKENEQYIPNIKKDFGEVSICALTETDVVGDFFIIYLHVSASPHDLSSSTCITSLILDRYERNPLFILRWDGWEV